MLGEISTRDPVRDTFEREGFFVFDPEIPNRKLDRAVEDMELGPRRHWLRFMRHHEGAGAGRVTDLWSRSKSVRSIALAPAVLDLLRRLYEREPHPFQTQNFRVGSEQPVHSDAVHFNTEPPDLMCAVWVALEDIDMDCGPLMLHPGSHTLPFVTPAEAGVRIEPGQTQVPWNDYTAHYEPYMAALVEREALEPFYGTLRKGQAVVWATNTLHGGSPVRVPGRTRLSQVTHYLLEGARLWTPLLSTDGQRHWREAPNI